MLNYYFTQNLLDMYQTKKLCDVKFIFANSSNSPEKSDSVEAHKLILAMNSDVFEAMIYGPNSKSLKKAPEDPKKVLVEIEDIEMPIFELMLNFIYGELIEFENVVQARDFYYAAEKYNCKGAIDFVSDYLSTETKKGHSILIYEVADLFNNMELKNASEKKFQVDPKIFEKDSFLEAKPETVEHIFKQEKLEIDSEVVLLKALERYVDHHKTRDPDIATKVRPALQKIRFLNLAYEEIVETPLLSHTEIVQILKCLKVNADLSEMPDGFTKERSKRKSVVSKRHTKGSGYSFGYGY